MARIPKHIVDQIYNATDILDVIGDYVQLKKRGANYWALSPFANEKTPSFAVNPQKGIFKDFSSGKGGNAIKFLEEMEGFTYIEALRHLARKYNIELEEEEESEEEKLARDRRQSLYIVNEFAAQWFQEQLLNTDEGRKIGLSYFKERGILDHSIETFQLGYAPDSWQALADAARSKQYSEAYLEELSLLSRSEKTGNLYDRFRGRVMFPITNVSGKVLGFGGRILGNQKEMAKYINSSESEIYHKSQVLYGLFQARQAIRNEDLCILTEGYMDVILLAQSGIKNVVASSGTALTMEQIRLIRRYTKRVLMIYDADAAGVKAALRGIDLLIQEGMEAQVLILPGKHDPDSYVREVGAAAFREYAEKEALSFIDFKMRALTQDRDANDPVVQSEIVRALADTLALLPDLIQRQMYVKHLAQRLDITEALMTHAVDEARRQVAKQQRQEQRRAEARQAGQAPETRPGQPAGTGPATVLTPFDKLELKAQEKEILRVMVNHFDKAMPLDPEAPLEDELGNPLAVEEVLVMDYLMGELEGLRFETPSYEQLKEELFTEFDTHETLDLNRYLNHPEPAVCSLMAELLTAPETSPMWNRIRPDLSFDGNLRMVADGAILHYKARKVEKLLTDCQEQVRQAQDANNEEALDRYLTTFLNLKNMRKLIHERLGTEGAVRGSDASL